MKKTAYFIFALFSIFYLLTSARITIPGITVLRWVGSGLLITYVLIHDKMKATIPYRYVYLLIALLPTLLGLAGEGTFYAYERIISLFLVCFGLEFFLNMNCVTRNDMANLMKIYTLIAGLLMIYSVIYPNFANDRMTGAYTNANFLSCIAMFAVVSSMALFCLSSAAYQKAVWISLEIISMYCVIQSGSRIGIGMLGMFVFAVPFFTKNIVSFPSVIKTIMQVSLIILGVTYALNHLQLVGVQRLLFFGESGNAFSREATWSDVWTIFSQKPIWGWGYAQVGYNVFVHRDYTYRWGMHSSYFVILCEMGIIGSVLMFAFFVSHYRKIYRNYTIKKGSYSDGERRFLKFLTLCNIVMLINAYSESFLFSVGNPMAICFWLPFILLQAYVKAEK